MNELMELVYNKLGATGGLAVAYIIVSILIVIMGIVCLVLEIRVWLMYSDANKIGISSRMSGMDAARYVLDQAGLNRVKVRKAGFIREALFGNYYNVATKTIYLRSWLGRIDDRQTVTAMALGVQKAAIARMCVEGDQQAIIRGRLSLIGIFGPILFIPVVLIGALIDMLLMDSITAISYVSMALGAVLLIAGFIVTMLNIPVEKRANKLALKMMREYGLANGEELQVMKGVYDAYILSYIAQFILEVLRIVQWILEVAIKLKKED